MKQNQFLAVILTLAIFGLLSLAFSQNVQLAESDKDKASLEQRVATLEGKVALLESQMKLYATQLGAVSKEVKNPSTKIIPLDK